MNRFARVFVVLWGILMSTGAIRPGVCQDIRNQVLEYCTGTWCQWCPCGHSIIRVPILQYLPNTIVIGYHGPANTSSEQFSFFSGNSIISGLGFNAYPTGLVDRTLGILSRSGWYSILSARATVPPTVRIGLTKSYDELSRQLTADFAITALTNLSDRYAFDFILLEDSLVAAQTGNSSCPGDPAYIHNHVVRAMISKWQGDTLNVTAGWSQGARVLKNYKYTVSASLVAKNCKIVAMVHKISDTLNLGEIQQAEEWPLLGTTVGVASDDKKSTPSAYELSQNYPNPFNPQTTIEFALPRDSYVRLQVYDALGQGVATLVDEYRAAGRYAQAFDASALTSGVYFFRLYARSADGQAGVFAQARKLALVR